jgi:hypothetical protein
MGTIDQKTYRLSCLNCKSVETQIVLEKGSNYGGHWENSVEFKKFITEWSGGGSVEPEITKAQCKTCANDADIQNAYKF